MHCQILLNISNLTFTNFTITTIPAKAMRRRQYPPVTDDTSGADMQGSRYILDGNYGRIISNGRPLSTHQFHVILL